MKTFFVSLLLSAFWGSASEATAATAPLSARLEVGASTTGYNYFRIPNDGANVIVPFLSEGDYRDHADSIKSVTQEMDEFGVPVSDIRAAFMCRPGASEDYLSEISIDVLSNDRMRATRGFIALTTLLSPRENPNVDATLARKALAPMVEAIRWRSSEALAPALANYEIIFRENWPEWVVGLPHISLSLQKLSGQQLIAFLCFGDFLELMSKLRSICHVTLMDT